MVACCVSYEVDRKRDESLAIIHRPPQSTSFFALTAPLSAVARFRLLYLGKENFLAHTYAIEKGLAVAVELFIIFVCQRKPAGSWMRERNLEFVI